MNTPMTIFLKIVMGSTLIACLLGIALDLVTANIAVEYFSVHHPQIVKSKNPFVLAFVWGIGASWWFGAISGAVIATINHRRQNPIAPGQILKWLFVACFILWVLMIAILLGVFATTSMIAVEERRSTFEQDRRLIAVTVTHQLEYFLGAVALIIISVKTWRTKSYLQ